MRSLIYILLLFLFFSSVSQAELIKTTMEEFSSPVTTDAKTIFWGGSFLTLILTFDKVEDSLGHDVQHETVENKPLGKLSFVGDLSGQMIPNFIYAASAFSLSYFTEDRSYYGKALHMAKSTLYAALFTSILKYTIREPRPNSKNRDAFPSGHTATAFAFASVVGTEHEWYWAIPAYGLASLTAYSRINDNAHQLHDVVGGAIIGTSYGLSIYYLNKNKDSFVTKFNIAPLYGGFFVSFRNSF